MNWIPTFLSPLAALIAAGIAVPLLLVLYFLKLRRREHAVSSTLLWKKTIQDLQVNAPFQKLRRNLLLLLQLALLLLLCLALARPVTFFTPGAGKSSVIIIDRSASMAATDGPNGRSRLDEAKRLAKAFVDTMERNSQAMLIAFDESATALKPFTTDRAALKTAIDSIEQTDRHTRLKLAYQLADANMGFNPEQLRSISEPPEVHIYSDGRVLDSSELSIKGKPVFEKIGTDTAGNVAIVALSAKRNYERPTEVQIFARLANFGPKPLNGDVELLVSVMDSGTGAKDDFKVRGVAGVSLPPQRWFDETWVAANAGARDDNFNARDSVEFTLDLSTAAVIKVEHRIKDGDLLAADDSAAVVVPPPKALEVALVTDGNYYLEKIINSEAIGLRKPITMSPAEYEQKLPTNFDVIIFDRGYAPPKLPPAGNFIYFGAVAPGLKLRPELKDGKNVVFDQTTVIDWKRDHPIFKNLSMSRLYVGEGIKLSVPIESEVLVEGGKAPLIVLHREARSTHLVIAFDLMQSNWPANQISFPLFIYYSLQYMAIGADLNVNQSYVPGVTLRIARTSLQQAGDNVKSVRLNGPGISRTLEVAETGDFSLPSLDKVGIYHTDPVIPQYERIAVNLLDETESNLLPSSKAPGGIGETIAGSGRKSRLDLWWWIVVAAALPLLMIEWWVYTRRVHL